MPTPPSFASLVTEYSDLFNSCVPGGRADGTIHSDRLIDIDQTVDAIMAHMGRYAAVTEGGSITGAAEVLDGMPPVFVGLIHTMEASGDFSQGLYNGDPLTRRTVNVPRGRPLQGEPPFTWEYVAIDALMYERTQGDWRGLSPEDWADWSVAGICYKLEAYNGWGSRIYHGTPTAYLWAGSNHYTSGKYVSDGVWDSNAVSDEEGAAVLLKRMTVKGLVALKATPVFVAEPELRGDEPASTGGAA